MQPGLEEVWGAGPAVDFGPSAQPPATLLGTLISPQDRGAGLAKRTGAVSRQAGATTSWLPLPSAHSVPGSVGGCDFPVWKEVWLPSLLHHCVTLVPICHPTPANTLMGEESS